VKSTLVDAGPLIALFDKDDRYHSHVLAFLRKYQGILATTWPVITEAIHMLGFSIEAQKSCLRWIKRRGLLIFDLGADHIERLIELMDKYSDLPMDLADASLWVASEELRTVRIATIDSDYRVYRPRPGVSFKNELAGYLR
jgi:predicted nucleic acid-binding protein